MRVRVCRLAWSVRVSRRARLHLLHDRHRQLPERLGRGRRWIEDDDRLAAVAADDDLRVDRDLAEKWNAEELGGPAAATVAEDLFALAAVAADEIAHVLDDAKDGHVHLSK